MLGDTDYASLTGVQKQPETAQPVSEKKDADRAQTPVARTFQAALSSFAKNGFQLQDKLAYRQYRYLTTHGLESVKHYFLYLLAGGVFGDVTRSFSEIKAHVEGGVDRADLRFYGQCCTVERLYRAFQGNRNDVTYKALEEAFETLHREFDGVGDQYNTQAINQILENKVGEDVRNQLLTYSACGGGKKFRQKLQMLFANYRAVVHTKEGLGYGTDAEIRQVFEKVLEERLDTEEGLKAAESLMGGTKLASDVQKINDRVAEVLETGQVDETLGAYGLPVEHQQRMLSLAAKITLLHETRKAAQEKSDGKLHEISYGTLFQIGKAIGMVPTQLMDPTLPSSAQATEVIREIEGLDRDLKELEARQRDSTSEEEKRSIQRSKEKTQALLDELKRFRVGIPKQRLLDVGIEESLLNATVLAPCFHLQVDDSTGSVSHDAVVLSQMVDSRLRQARSLLVTTLAPKEPSSDLDEFFSVDSTSGSSEEEISSDTTLIN